MHADIQALQRRAPGALHRHPVGAGRTLEIGAALAEISGLRCLILDRFDVLDLPGRADALGLVDALAADGRMDTILVLGTLKAAPPAPSDVFTVHWIEQGHAGPAKLKEAA